MGSKGGKASAKAKKERKLMSQIYADILLKRLSVPFEEGTEEMTGLELVEHAVKTALATGGSPAVSMMKEIREATEGSKVAMVIEDRTPFEFVDPPKKDNADR